MPTTSMGMNSDPPKGQPTARSRMKMRSSTPEIPRELQQNHLSIDNPFAASMHGAPRPVAAGAKKVSVRWTLPPGHNKDHIVSPPRRGATGPHGEINVPPAGMLARLAQATKAEADHGGGVVAGRRVRGSVPGPSALGTTRRRRTRAGCGR